MVRVLVDLEAANNAERTSTELMKIFSAEKSGYRHRK